MALFILNTVSSIILAPFLGKCTGIENIPLNKGVILTANHSSYLDHFVISCKLFEKISKPIYFLAKKEHFETFFQRKWHNYIKAIPLDRQAGGTEALSKAIEHLKKSDLIMIYPEGTRTLTGKMNRAKTGVARLALAANVPVIPMGITNTFKILPKGKNLPKFGLKADLNIGKPLYFDKYYGKENDKETLREVTTIIMKDIAKLSKQEYPFDK
jgi:1-acyl-sn-glycerol-3-phosphate acyltransferase